MTFPRENDPIIAEGERSHRLKFRTNDSCGWAKPIPVDHGARNGVSGKVGKFQPTLGVPLAPKLDPRQKKPADSLRSTVLNPALSVIPEARTVELDVFRLQHFVRRFSTGFGQDSGESWSTRAW